MSTSRPQQPDGRELPDLQALGEEIAQVRARIRPATAPPTTLGRIDHRPLATFDRRCAATFADMLILGALGVALALPAERLERGLASGPTPTFHLAAAAAIVSVALALTTLLPLLAWTLLNGRSPGKAWQGLSVVGTHGRLTPLRHGVRFGLKWGAPVVGFSVANGVGDLERAGLVPGPAGTAHWVASSAGMAAYVAFLGWFLALGRRRLALHDRLAGTRVIALGTAEDRGFEVVQRRP